MNDDLYSISIFHLPLGKEQKLPTDSYYDYHNPNSSLRLKNFHMHLQNKVII